MLIRFLREHVNSQNPFLLFYHKVMAICAAIFYRFPADHLKVISVTGTNGKTTVTHMIAKILEEAGFKIGLTSTIAFQVGESKWPNIFKQTTMGRFALQKLLRAMVDANCEYAVIEVTSHAMVQHRTWGINVDTAVFTNITEDHIEYHGSKEEYVRAKGLLFEKVEKSKRKPSTPKVIILNGDDPEFDYFNKFTADRKIVFGKGRTVSAENITLSPGGSEFILKVPNAEKKVSLHMPGEFNIENALSAASAAIGQGISLQVIADAFLKMKPLPGRYESINEGQDFSVIIDYAHAPDSLEKLCQLFRTLTIGKLFIVFGATGGGRDKKKRPRMGEIADKFCDYIVLTNDDPYTEDPMQIINGIAEGIKREEGNSFWKIPDRRKAIEFALEKAARDDTVLITGKGCEEIQIIGYEKIPWDDRKVVKEILKNLHG